MKKLTAYSFFGVIALAVLAFKVNQDMLSSLSAYLKSYYETVQPNQIHLSFNQPKYIAGDTVYFKGYLVSKSTSTLRAGKHTLNITLSNSQNEVVLSRRMLFKDGLVSNQLILPLELDPGIYSLEAFLDETLNNESVKGCSYNFKIAGKQEFATAVLRTEFSLEEESFINGLESIITVTGESGKRIQLLNNDGVVEDTTIGENGMVYFKLIPKEGEHYFIKDENNTLNIPDVRNDGVAIYFSPQKSDSVEVSIAINSKSNWHNKDLMIVKSSGDKINFNKKINFYDGDKITLRLLNLTEGRLAIFGNNAEFVSEISLPGRDSIQTIIDIPKDVHTRSTIKTDISFKDKNGNSVKASCSVSIFKQSLIKPGKRLVPYSENNKNVWLDILKHKDTKPKISKTPFYFRGKVSNSEVNKISLDSIFLTFYLNNNDIVYGLYPKKDGTFEFPLFMEFEDDNVFYTATNRGKSLNDVEIVFSTLPTRSMQNRFAYKEGALDQYTEYALKRRIVQNSYQFFQSSKTNKISHSDFFDDVSGVEIDFRKYESFGSMAEVISSIVSVVKYRKYQEAEGLRVFMKESATYAKGNPVYVINGLMTDNTEYFLKLNPNDVNRIKILRSSSELARYGFLGTNGIILVETNDDKINVETTNRNFFVSGITKPISFNNKLDVVHSTKTRVPDLRSSLFWEPNLLITEKGATVQFSTSDDLGEYVVKVEGLTDGGVFFSNEKSFVVKR